MADHTTTETIQVPGGNTSSAKTNILSPDTTIVLFTWIIFVALLIVLQKFAWNPMLSALDRREKDIRAALENADRIKAELEQVQKARDQIIIEAHKTAKNIVDQSRKAAIETANAIQQKAKDEGKIMVDNALREISEATDEARANLLAEGAKIAVKLAGKLIEENLDTEKNLKLVNQYIKEI